MSKKRVDHAQMGSRDENSGVSAAFPPPLATGVCKKNRVCREKGGPLFLSLTAQGAPLSANSVGRLTKKKCMRSAGLPDAWGAHSTRGAAVQFFKALGLSTEHVCELGQWKIFSAFRDHYLRIGAANSATEKIQKALVHIVSSEFCATNDPSCTPGTGQDTGGEEGECGAQKADETSLLRRRSVQKLVYI